VPRDVLEFVVFEHHIASSEGQWRVHEKVVPKWMPDKMPAIQTRQLGMVNEEDEEKAIAQILNAK